jgi:hypothetical protein
MKLEIWRQIFEESSNIKFYQHLFSGSRVPWRQTDMTNLVVAFRSFVNAPKNLQIENFFPFYSTNEGGWRFG